MYKLFEPFEQFFAFPFLTQTQTTTEKQDLLTVQEKHPGARNVVGQSKMHDSNKNKRAAWRFSTKLQLPR